MTKLNSSFSEWAPPLLVDWIKSNQDRLDNENIELKERLDIAYVLCSSESVAMKYAWEEMSKQEHTREPAFEIRVSDAAYSARVYSRLEYSKKSVIAKQHTKVAKQLLGLADALVREGLNQPVLPVKFNDKLYPPSLLSAVSDAIDNAKAVKPVSRGIVNRLVKVLLILRHEAMAYLDFIYGSNGNEFDPLTDTLFLSDALRKSAERAVDAAAAIKVDKTQVLQAGAEKDLLEKRIFVTELGKSFHKIFGGYLFGTLATVSGIVLGVDVDKDYVQDLFKRRR